MARKSKFTDKQWDKILNRVPPLGNESIRSVARELDIAEGSIRQRIKTHQQPINELANQIATVESKFEALPINAQVKVRTLADMLKGISEHLAGAASNGAMTAHRLSQIANAKAQEIDETDTIDANTEALKSVLAMTRGANDAAQIGLNLLSANKETVKQINDSGSEDSKPKTLMDFYGGK